MILVGNGHSALSKLAGKQIDSFDTVVRFSWFWVDGYEQYVGSKTDIWATTIYCSQRLRENNFQQVIAHSWQWNPEKCKTFAKLNEYDLNLRKTTSVLIDEMCDFAGLDKRYCFSTGAIISWLLLKETQELTLYGFDWTTQLQFKKHHYGDQQVAGSLHEPRKEYKFFSRLHKEGKINYL
jgi:hypothetical protein